jgi:hypothetical protein
MWSLECWTFRASRSATRLQRILTLVIRGTTPATLHPGKTVEWLMNKWMNEWGWSIDGPNPTYSEKTLPQCHFVQHSLHAQKWYRSRDAAVRDEGSHVSRSIHLFQLFSSLLYYDTVIRYLIWFTHENVLSWRPTALFKTNARSIGRTTYRKSINYSSRSNN